MSSPLTFSSELEEFFYHFAIEKNCGQRYGQAIFNALYETDYIFADSVRGTTDDCFYDDSKADALFLKWLFKDETYKDYGY